MLLLAQIPQQTTFPDAILESLRSLDFWFQMVVILFGAPIWYPILRAMYREINRSLRAEGGVFARSYTPRELEAFAKHEEPRHLPLKSVPRIDPIAKARERRATPPPRAAARGGAERSGRLRGATGRAVHSRRAPGF
jgi:hypothetical protein